jgi:pimeloyl-ACP methyl ester carboxylesterase
MGRRHFLRRIVRRVTAGAPVGGRARPPERTYEVAAAAGPVPLIEQGTGPVILIMHGGSGDATAWAGVADRLAGEFRVLRYTRPTYRWTPPPHGAEAVSAEVADALGVARSVGEPVVVVGHSSGAVVALQAALTDPEPFAAVAVYEPPLDVTHSPAGQRALAAAQQALAQGERLRAMRIHLRDLVGMPRRMVVPTTLLPPARRFFRRYAPGQIADNEMLDALPDGLERFRDLQLPVLLISGAKSPAHLQTRSSELAAVLPEVAGEVTLTGQGHGANLGAPDALAEALTAFARQVLG